MSLVALLLMLMAVGDAGLRPGDHTRSLSLKGMHRSYPVHVPPQYDPGTPMPVVLAFHGGGANADNMVVLSGLNEKADQAGHSRFGRDLIVDAIQPTRGPRAFDRRR